MTSGLHACKPGNEPVVGQVKTFAVQQMTSQNGKPYTKIRSASAENGGLPYKILSAKPTGYTDSHGNISFNVEIEPSNGAVAQPQQARANHSPITGESSDRSSRIERQHSQEQAIRYATLKGLTTITTEELRALIDWFQRDVGHVPSSPSARDIVVAQAVTEDADQDETDEPPF